jgi:NAD(P)-dependent dehydrogenase (short-subunit alcohol dehydrogenase family)
MTDRTTSTLSDPPRRIALITGAGRRIGRALALGFAAHGWDVGVHYHRSRDHALTVVEEIEVLGGRAVALEADLADEAAVASLVPDLADAIGVPNCVINCASVFEEDSATDFRCDLLAKMMAVNVGAPLALARALHAATPDDAIDDERLRGVVINVLDQKLFNLNPDFLSYTLTKAALETATTMLATALAPKLRVVGLAPGLTLQAFDQSPEEFERAHRSAPLRAGSRPADLVDAALYLAEARAVTGTTLLVDGGEHLNPSLRPGADH